MSEPVHGDLPVGVRAIFISDVHLGSRFARPQMVQRFLEGHQPQYLYLVGDIIDGRVIQRTGNWPDECGDLLHHIGRMGRRGTKVCYTPGNHDDYLRDGLASGFPVRIEDRFIHRCADGRRLLVLHGDLFDDVEAKAAWLSRFGSVLYEGLLWVDRGFNRLWKKVSRRRVPISRVFKQSAKEVVQWFSGFETRVLAHAQELGCQGAICGHIHVPRYRRRGDLLYVNLGDWVENATALVELSSGELRLLQLDHLAEATSPVRPAPIGVPLPFPMPPGFGPASPEEELVPEGLGVS